MSRITQGRFLHCLSKRIVAHRSTAGNRSGGQSLVEFALVFPLLMFLLLTIVDFGRLFNAGIMIESASVDVRTVLWYRQ